MVPAHSRNMVLKSCSRPDRAASASNAPRLPVVPVIPLMTLYAGHHGMSLEHHGVGISTLSGCEFGALRSIESQCRCICPARPAHTDTGRSGHLGSQMVQHSAAQTHRGPATVLTTSGCLRQEQTVQPQCSSYVCQRSAAAVFSEQFCISGQALPQSTRPAQGAPNWVANEVVNEQ